MVSIVIPLYNAKKYIKECLDSILLQSYSDYEIIIVDDFSTDGSKDIVFSYKDERIKYFLNEKKGCANARNYGLSKASGDFVYFLDSDDYLESNMLNTCVNHIKDCDLCVFTNHIYCEESANVINTLSLNPMLKDYEYTKDIYDKLYLLTNPNAWTKLFKRSFLLENNLYFEDLPMANDLTFTYSALACSKKIAFLNQPLVYYRINHGTNISAKRDNIAAFFKAIKALYLRLLSLGIFDLVKDSFYKRIKSSFLYEKSFCNLDYDAIEKIIEFVFKDYKEVKQFFLLQCPKISIIICVYNKEEFINRCLDSVINNTFKQIQIIIINDGSTDRSLNIIRVYNDYRISIFNQANSGLAIARNEGIKKANAKYIFFLDADDFIHKNCLSKIYNKMQINNLDMCLYKASNYIESSKKIEKNPYYSLEVFANNFKEVFNYEDCKDFITRIAVSSCLTAYKKDFLLENDIFFINERLCYEDNLFFAKALFKAKRISLLRKNIYYRSINNKSITANINNNFQDRIKMTILLMRLLKQMNIENDIFYKYLYSYVGILYNIYDKFDNNLKNKYKDELLLSFIILNLKYKISNQNILAFLKTNNLSHLNYIQNASIVENTAQLISKIQTKKSNGLLLAFKKEENNFFIKAKNSGLIKMELYSDANIYISDLFINAKQIIKDDYLVNKATPFKYSFRCKDNDVFNIAFKSSKKDIYIKIRNIRNSKRDLLLLKNPNIAEYEGKIYILSNANFKIKAISLEDINISISNNKILEVDNIKSKNSIKLKANKEYIISIKNKLNIFARIKKFLRKINAF
ncbi:glycosyltransferase family 2 protein [Campylobacter canadensis]|uniref:glycosyltransferase family 2 protein n=1 Tax=Campylobacter canadensis TaxID=449520 RepID=UPI001CC96793|nr:glycosyltransferase family 2 protein [Campylobacter canadensis]MBZ8003083.1 glycosyltransferase [Campylobacter canadensis]